MVATSGRRSSSRGSSGAHRNLRKSAISLSANVEERMVSCGVFLILLLSLAVGVYWMESDEQVFEQTFEFNTSAGGEASFVTGLFPAEGAYVRCRTDNQRRSR